MHSLKPHWEIASPLPSAEKSKRDLGLYAAYICIVKVHSHRSDALFLRRPRRIPLPHQMARIRSSLLRSIRPTLEIDPDQADIVTFTRDVHAFALRAVWHGFVAADIASTARPTCS